jgi:elongation factor G
MTRTIAVLGAAQTGKSTLIDAMCGLEGRAAPPAEAGELRVADFEHLGETWQAIDTPGSVEFLPVASAALLAADAAVICVAPDPDAAVLAAPYLRLVERAGTPSLIFINRIDEAQGRVRDIVAALQQYVGQPIILRQIPIRDGDEIAGAVDLVSERAWAYREGEPSELIELPPGMIDREQEAREAMLEHLSEFDDWLLEELVEDRRPASDQVFSLCARVLSETRAIEALIGAAARGNGIVRILKALRHEAPGPETLRARLAAQTGLAELPSAVVFAGAHRKHMGKTLLLRALEDLPASQSLGGRPPGQMTPSDPRDGRHLDAVSAGTIVTAVKADHLEAGRLATEAALHRAPDWHEAAAPMQSRILAPVVERDGAKLPGVLAALASGDPGLHVSQDPVTGGALVGTQGPLHLRVLRQRLRDTFGIEVEEVVPNPAYRETIARSRDIAYRHKKQTGGAGQFADVKLTVRPAARGAGFSFADTVKGGAVPKNYIPAVETGARDAMETGPLGFPVVDVSVTLTDGLAHSVDSSEMAFRIAGRHAVRDALKAAGPVLLQPVYRVEIHAPAIFTGAVGPIVSSHHGQVLGFDAHPTARGWEIYGAMIPGGELQGFANDIRAATQGVGHYEADLDHYEEVHGKTADRIVREHSEELAG